MAYTLNRTDGNTVATVADGAVDFSRTLGYVGKNFSGYGEIFNENFIKLQENFANTSPPAGPLEGQLWWDKNTSILKIYQGPVLGWKSVDTVGGGGGGGGSGPYTEIILSNPGGKIIFGNGSEQTTAYTGNYNDLTNKPTIPAAQIQSDWNQSTNTALDFIKNKPTIPAAPVNANWNAVSGLAQILNKPSLSTVATSGSYGDLLNKPNLSTVATSGSYADLLNKPTIPTKTSDLTNDSSFITSNGIPSQTGNSGKFLKTDGTNVSWDTPAAGGASSLNDLTDVIITSAASGQVLKYNGANWINDTVGGGGGLVSRSVAAVTTSSLANNATANVSITGFKSYLLLKITISHAAWVRLYTHVNARTADATRTISTDPLPGSGVLAEFITTGTQTIFVTPVVMGFNGETVPTTSIPIAVTNRSGASNAITVTLTLLQLEA